MSKIDLFDQQWIDLVFEGKNEAYGAYKMRQNTGNRNLMAMLALIAGIAGIVGFFLLYGVAKDAVFSDEGPATTQTVADFTDEDAKKEEEQAQEEIFDEPEPEPEIEVQAIQDIANSDLVTDFASEDNKEKEVVQTAAEANEGTAVTADVSFHEGSNEGTEIRNEDAELGNQKVEVEEEKVIHTIVEQMPTFPGGDGALMKYLSSNLRYPPRAEEMGIKGRVTCQFVVERDGSITDVKVVRGVDPDLDREAVRVIKSMPRWIPGKQNGKSVRVRYTCPINFTLQ